MPDNKTELLNTSLEQYDFANCTQWELEQNNLIYDKEVLTRIIRERDLHLNNAVYAWVSTDFKTDNRRVLYVGKASTIIGRLDGHRFSLNKLPLSDRSLELRRLLQERANIDIFVKFISTETTVLCQDERLPAFHLEELAFIQKFRPHWNFETRSDVEWGKE